MGGELPPRAWQWTPLRPASSPTWAPCLGCLGTQRRPVDPRIHFGFLSIHLSPHFLPSFPLFLLPSLPSFLWYLFIKGSGGLVTLEEVRPRGRDRDPGEAGRTRRLLPGRGSSVCSPRGRRQGRRLDTAAAWGPGCSRRESGGEVGGLRGHQHPERRGAGCHPERPPWWVSLFRTLCQRGGAGTRAAPA